MFDNSNNNLFDVLIGDDNNSEVEELSRRIQILDNRENMKSILNDQLNDVGMRIDIISQITSIKDKGTQFDLLDEVLGILVSRYNLVVDVDSIRVDLETLTNATRLIYDLVYYHSNDILSILFKEVLLRNENTLNELFRMNRDTVSKRSLSFIKNNMGNTLENTHKLYTLVDVIFRDWEEFSTIMGRDDLYESLPDINHPLIDLIKDQPTSVIANIYKDRVFTNSLVTSIFRNQLKSSLLSAMKKAQENSEQV